MEELCKNYAATGPRKYLIPAKNLVKAFHSPGGAESEQAERDLYNR